MIRVGRLRDAIQWHEGMLLLPHHFQQADRRIDQLLQFHINTAVSHHWGITHYKLDPTALVSGTLRLLELEAVMPDGLIVSSYQSEGDKLEVDLSPFREQMQKQELSIYLSVPAYRPGSANVTGTFPRYASEESKEFLDENTGEAGVRIPCIRPNLNLIVGETPPPRYESFPLFKMIWAANAYQLTDYTPPLLKVATESPLGASCLDLAKRIREKLAFLTDRIHSRTAEMMSAEAETAVRSLSQGLLPFETLLQSGVAHPFQLFLSLCTLAGHASGLQPGQMPPSFRPYNHNNIREDFKQVIDFIISMLNRIQEGYLVIPFTLKERVFSLPLKQAWMRPKLVLGAKSPPGMSEKELVEWINNAVIATDRFVVSVRDKRILGAARKIIPGDEEMKLLPAQNVVLFAVDYDRDFIDPDETLQIFNVADTPEKRPEELVFYVPKADRNVFL